MAHPSTISRLPSFRDRALIATPTYSFARITVALKTEIEDLRQLTRFIHEVGGYRLADVA